MRHLREISAELFVMAAIGLVMGLLGPFGSFAMPMPQRMLSWMLFALLGYACYRPVIAAGDALAAQTAVPRPAAMAMACAIAALPVTLLVAWMLGGLRASAIQADALVALYPYVLLVGGLTTTIQLLLFARRRAAPMTAIAPIPGPTAVPEAALVAEPVAVPAAPAFLDRLPPAIGRDLLCLQMEDHYVRAHTPLGSALILMRMRDATAELGALEGARVHRSWWVARAAVERTVRRDRAVALRLVNGLDVPIARNALPELRAAGWL